MEAIDDKESAVRFLRRFTVRQKGPVNKELFRAAIRILEQEAVENGLEDDVMDICIEFFVKPFISNQMKKAVLCCLLPCTIVQDSVTKKLLCWIFSEYQYRARPTLVLALKWVIGVLQFELTDPAVVDGFYPLFYKLLPFQKLEREACKLLHEFTKPDDVNRWRVNQVLEIRVEVKRQKHVSALLSLFKAYRPEFVPEKVPSLNVTFAFGKLPMKLEKALRDVADRKHASGQREPWLQTAKWNMPGKTGGLIPPISYIHFESQLYRKADTRQIVEFTSIEELCQYQLTLDIPCNVISLLATEEGRHVLAFADRTIQSRLYYYLFYTLQQAFLLAQIRATDSEREELLQHIYELENYTRQGVRVVSQFLAEYIMGKWDGTNFFKEILQLLEWITFDSFSELYDMILLPLKSYFRLSKVWQKCAFIRMFGRMIQNVLLVRDHPFPRDTQGQREKLASITSQLCKFVEELLDLGLLYTPQFSTGHSQLLNEALSFYELMAEVGVRSGLSVWTVVSPIVLYKSFYSRRAVAINRVCALLLSYRKNTYPHLTRLGTSADFENEKSLVNAYFVDLNNCLWANKAFAGRQNGHIFKGFKTEDFGKYDVNIDFAFNVLYHPAFQPFMIDYLSKCEMASKRPMEKEGLRIIGRHFPAIGELIRTYQLRTNE